MELEGFGVSLVGRSAWSYGGRIPWEFLNSVHYGTRLLVCGSTGAATATAIMEGDWTCVWRPRQTKDWSYIATVLRGSQGPCLIVFADLADDSIPHTFVGFLDSLTHEHRMTVSRVWLNGSTSPPWIPDAIFFAPFGAHEDTMSVFEMLRNLPGRGGHGTWSSMSAEAWLAVVAATRDQGLGLVLSDVEESSWTLMWHRPADSLLPLERRNAVAASWIQAAADMLK
jgi:hypothetical protein